MKPSYKCLLFSFSLFLFCGISRAQSDIRTPQGIVYYNPNLYKTKYEFPDGSPYINEKFLPSKINEMSDTQFIRFNAFEGLVEVSVSGNRVVVLDDSAPYMIYLQDGSGRIYQTLYFRDDNGQAQHSFFERLHENENYTLYIKERKKFYKKEKAQGYQKAKPARFTEISPVFYINDIWNNSDKLIELPFRLNNLLEMFPAQAKSMKSLAKKENLKTDNKEDLIRLLNFYFENQ